MTYLLVIHTRDMEELLPEGGAPFPKENAERCVFSAEFLSAQAGRTKSPVSQPMSPEFRFVQRNRVCGAMERR